MKLPIKIVSRKKYNDMKIILDTKRKILDDIVDLLNYANKENASPIKRPSKNNYNQLYYKVDGKIIFYRYPISKIVCLINDYIRSKTIIKLQKEVIDEVEE